jgi:hypothetical protein
MVALSEPGTTAGSFTVGLEKLPVHPYKKTEATRDRGGGTRFCEGRKGGGRRKMSGVGIWTPWAGQLPPGHSLAQDSHRVPQPESLAAAECVVRCFALLGKLCSFVSPKLCSEILKQLSISMT